MLSTMQALLDGAVLQQGPLTLQPLGVPSATHDAELRADQSARNQQSVCDASWCNCRACKKPKGRHGACDLCAHRWVFIISAGRSGSTSLLEGLNSLPGVSLGGENFAMVNVAREMVDRADKLQQRGDSAPFEMKNEELSTDVLCSMQDVFAKLTDHELHQTNGGKQTILGFKELVALPSAGEWHGGAKGVPHLAAGNTDWLDFIDRLFPCAKIVFNTRRDIATQSRAIASTFDSARGMPLHKIERDVRAVNANFERWHAERSSGNTSKSRSFMMYAEDLAPGRFTQLAHWLGLNCTFTAIPHANDPTATPRLGSTRAQDLNNTAWVRRDGQYFHHDYTNIRSQCDSSPVDPAAAVTMEARAPPPLAPLARQDPHGEEELDHQVESAECSALPLLPSHPKCAPTPDDMARMLGSKEGASWDRSHFNMSEIPTFFLHEDGVFNFSDVTSCFVRAVGSEPDLDDLDEHVFPDVAMHLADLWYLKQFRTHPRRVYDPAEATIHVVGVALTAAFRAHRGEKWDPSWKSPRLGGKLGGPYGCGNMDVLHARLGKVARYLSNSFYFQRHLGRDWLLLNSFYWVKTVLGDELGELALQGPMLFTTSDRQYVHYRELLNESAVVPSVIPYKSHYALDDAAWIDSKYPQTTPRHSQLMFHGSTGRGSSTNRRNEYTEGSLRGLMCDALRESFRENSSLNCVRHYAMTSATSLLQTQVGKAKSSADATGQKPPGPTWLAVTSGRRASLQTVSSYLSSKLCPVPAGDTPTSRRLFDAMAGGCIPILFAPFEDIAPNLPFPSSLNWKRLALFGGGLTCSFVEHRNETVGWLRKLLDPAHEAGLECLRKRVRSAYRRHISLRGHGAVTSLLFELQRRPNPPAWERPDASASTARTQLEATCHVEVRCGCSAQDTVFVRYHMAGQKLMQDLTGEMESRCNIPDQKLVDAGSAADGKLDGCRNLKLSLDEENLHLWPLERLKNLSQPRRNTRFVHLVREPLSLLAEYYTHAASPGGKIGGPAYSTLWASVIQMTAVEGMMHVAELILQRQLPAMAKLHALFRSQCNQSKCPTRDDVTELRYEELLSDFNEQTARIGRAAGVAERCATNGSALSEAFGGHRPALSEKALWYTRNAAGGAWSVGAQKPTLAVLPSALASLLQERSPRSYGLVRRLQAYGEALGYNYSAEMIAFASHVYI